MSPDLESSSDTQTTTSRPSNAVPIIASVLVAVIGVSIWWSTTMTPPTVEVMPGAVDQLSEPDQQDAPAEGGAGIDSTPAVAEMDVSDLEAYVVEAIENGDASAVVEVVKQWLDSRELEDLADRAVGEYLLARALASAGRKDAAEVHLLNAADHTQQLGESGEQLVTLITRALSDLVVEPEDTATVEKNLVTASGVTRIPVSLKRDFVTFERGMSLGATPTWSPLNHRLEELPLFKLREPPYRGDTQLYGAIKLGIAKESLFSFVFDLVQDGPPVVWFDRNANYDLTDDGPPLENQGDGVFASEVVFLLHNVLPGFSNADTFRIWFFTNDSLWSKRFAAHYCTTVLKGTVRFAGRSFDAFVTDTGGNEADFTNDGLYVDLDANGRVSAEELIAPKATLKFDGGRYQFDIKW